MAQRVRIELTDDLLDDGTVADETVQFALDGISYEIDLSSDNAAKLREDLAVWIAAAPRKQSSGRKQARAASGRRARAAGGPSATEIREWARAQGMEVSDRGRVRDDVRAAYEAAH